MSDMIEAVALKVQHAVEQMPYRDFTELTADGSTERPTTLREFFENTWQGEHADEVFSAAAKVATRTAITAHTAALIAGAGELCTALKFHGRYGSESHDQMTARKNGERDEAAATIAALRAELANARLEGVRLGIKASAGVADHLGGGRVERNDDGSLRTYDMNCKHDRGSAVLNSMRVRAQTIAVAIRALDPAAIAKGITTADTLSDLIAGDAHLIDAPYATKADSGRECGHPACALYGRCMTGDCQLRGRTLADSDGDDGA